MSDTALDYVLLQPNPFHKYSCPLAGDARHSERVGRGCRRRGRGGRMGEGERGEGGGGMRLGLKKGEGCGRQLGEHCSILMF